MPRPVPDEIWQQLDPDAGAPTVQARRRLALALALVGLLSLGVGYGWHAGLLVPRLDGSANGVGTSPGEIQMPVTLTNQNQRVAVEVRGVGRSGSGLKLIRTEGSTEQTLAPGESMTVTLVYRITDCAAVTDRPWPVPVQVARPWGTQTVHVHLPTWSSDAADDSDAVEWQRYFAHHTCTTWG